MKKKSEFVDINFTAPRLTNLSLNMFANRKIRDTNLFFIAINVNLSNTVFVQEHSF